jgi:para-nitrobenzyl esterase
MYQFTWETDFKHGMFKAGHSVEIPFVFDTIDDMEMSGQKPDRPQMVENMSNAWIAFARTGSPSHPGIPRWGTYSAGHRETMLIDVPCRVALDPDRDEIAAWDGIDVFMF